MVMCGENSYVDGQKVSMSRVGHKLTKVGSPLTSTSSYPSLPTSADMADQGGEQNEQIEQNGDGHGENKRKMEGKEEQGNYVNGSGEPKRKVAESVDGEDDLKRLRKKVNRSQPVGEAVIPEGLPKRIFANPNAVSVVSPSAAEKRSGEEKAGEQPLPTSSPHSSQPASPANSSAPKRHATSFRVNRVVKKVYAVPVNHGTLDKSLWGSNSVCTPLCLSLSQEDMSLARDLEISIDCGQQEYRLPCDETHVGPVLGKNLSPDLECILQLLERKIVRRPGRNPFPSMSVVHSALSDTADEGIKPIPRRVIRRPSSGSLRGSGDNSAVDQDRNGSASDSNDEGKRRSDGDEVEEAERSDQVLSDDGCGGEDIQEEEASDKQWTSSSPGFEEIAEEREKSGYGNDHSFDRNKHDSRDGGRTSSQPVSSSRGQIDGLGRRTNGSVDLLWSDVESDSDSDFVGRRKEMVDEGTGRVPEKEEVPISSRVKKKRTEAKQNPRRLEVVKKNKREVLEINNSRNSEVHRSTASVSHRSDVYPRRRQNRDSHRSRSPRRRDDARSRNYDERLNDSSRNGDSQRDSHRGSHRGPQRDPHRGRSARGRDSPDRRRPRDRRDMRDQPVQNDRRDERSYRDSSDRPSSHRRGSGRGSSGRGSSSRRPSSRKQPGRGPSGPQGHRPRRSALEDYREPRYSSRSN